LINNNNNYTTNSPNINNVPNRGNYNNNVYEYNNNNMQINNRSGSRNSFSANDMVTATLNGNQGVNNNINNNKNINGYQNRKIMCFRCFQVGHKVSECLYSFRQFVEMEEKGTIPNHLNH